MAEIYQTDILREGDSLERTMGQIYTDTYNPGLRGSATAAFRALLQLFARRVAETTNNIDASRQRWLYRMLAGFLQDGVAPEDITVITFNQDLQVEKSLCLLSERGRWSHIAPQLFNFPGCYALDERPVTAPQNTPEKDLFKMSGSVEGVVRILKLHGSLNWYSSHTSAQPSQEAMFRSSRKLRITRRRIIKADMMISGKKSTHALPIVVPPVTHKSSVLHDDLRGVWRHAEKALDEADELVVFGYSCPPLDFESANQLRRSQLQKKSRVSVIDPDGSIATRYIEMLKPAALAYYSSARAFLDAHPSMPH
jgi:hypothetical protein